ncbi:MAG: hypothetical protein V1838_05920 [Patescibacteria group bacterium]
MSAETMEAYTTIAGTEIQVDVSPEACQEFGFEPGDRVNVPRIQNDGTVIGVAPVPDKLPDHCKEAEVKALWIAMDDNDGKVCFFPSPQTNLRKI